MENQRKPDKRKKYSWPAYVANVRHRLRCPVQLPVLTPTRNLAYRCAEPIDLGCGELRPVALPMTALEPVTDPDQARREPEVAILAAAIHRTEDPVVIRSLQPAFDAIDAEQRSRYSDYLGAALPAAARKLLEDILTVSYEWRSDVGRASYAEGEAKGKAEGKAETILTMLESRGLTISEHVRQRITECTDIDQLDAWARRAATIDHAEDLFS
ncbi:hypothetical protein F4561_005362 [Lipingzhangella halophila]|uniref:Uncharacterized protein n=1 Tax=Lipingzhangella halophila TaxID=1783352 RepID=A0A7W7W4U4_9ACTN|nr:hypothetical protein [Lipingzhangella halophila]MBB4934542.1 hypothetical protein [Lipingzhangella halophila]